MHRFWLLGRIDLRDASANEVAAVLAQPKRLALLAYLALTARSGPARRDTLLALLWPELDQTRARKALNKAVHFVRRALGNDVLVSRTTEDLAVDSRLLWCDAVALIEAQDAGRIDQVVELYGGELLPGFYADVAPEFEEWLERERTRLRRLMADAARRLAEQREQSRQFTSAVSLARRAVELSGDDERGVRQVLELLDRLGDRAGALDAYDKFARRLATEFDAEPAAETRHLIAQIRAREKPLVEVDVRAPRTFPSYSPQSDVDSRSGGEAAVEPAFRDAQVESTGADGRRFTSAGIVMGLVGCVAIAAGLIRKAADVTGESVRVDPNVVAVAPFDVFEPSLAVWREGMTTLLSPLLDGAGPLRTIPAMQIVHRWTGKAERESATQLGRATGAGVVVYGHLLSSGADSVRVFATVLEVRSGGTTDFEVRDRADRFDRVCDSVAILVLRHLGHIRALAAVRGGGIASEPIPVLKAYLLGEQHYRHSRPESALVYFERATSLDSTFALAWRRRMGALTMVRAETDSEVRDFGLRAGRLNHGLAPRESLLVVADSLYQALMIQSGDPEATSHLARLHATLQTFTRRYPEDAEGWFLLARARVYVPLAGQSLDQTFSAFDRAIQLDSLFLPAIDLPIEAVLLLGQNDRALRYLRARLSRRVSPAANDGIRFAIRMLENPRDGYKSLPQWADTVGLSSAMFAMQTLRKWPDSGEAAVQVARALIRRNTLPRVAPSNVGTEVPEWQWQSAYTLLLRGHIREAWQVFQYPAWFGNFGGVPAESAAAMFERRPPPGLPWWAARRDTVSLRRHRARFDSLARLSSGQARLARYNRDRADVYLILARGDTSTAIDKFAWLIDSACFNCSWTHQSTDIYVAAGLLEHRGRGRDALRWLERYDLTVTIPLYEIAMESLRGRIAEQLGQRETASAAYGRVAGMWARADPELQPMVAEANAGLRRLKR